MKLVWSVGAAGDPVIARLPAALLSRGIPVRHVEAERLSDLRVTLDAEELWIEGETVGGLLFRAPANSAFSASFAESDRAFCDAETRAIWLAALNLPGMRAFNRLDAIAWFESEHWTVARRVLARSPARLTACELGYGRAEGSRAWLPFTTPIPQPDPGAAVASAGGLARFAEQRFERSLVACGRVVAGPGGDGIAAAVDALSRWGVSVAEIVLGEDGGVAWVDTQPRDLADDHAQSIAAAIAEHIAEGRP